MDRLSLILPKVLRKRGLFGEMTAGMILLKAQQWLDESFALKGVLKAARYDDGTITIDAMNAIALSECSQRQEELIDFLRKELPEARILGIRVLRSRG